MYWVNGNDIDLHNCATVWVTHGSQFRESKSVAALAWSGGTAADVHLGDTVILVAVIYMIMVTLSMIVVTIIMIMVTLIMIVVNIIIIMITMVMMIMMIAECCLLTRVSRRATS